MAIRIMSAYRHASYLEYLFSKNDNNLYKPVAITHRITMLIITQSKNLASINN